MSIKILIIKGLQMKKTNLLKQIYVKCILGKDDVQCNVFIMKTHCNEG